MSLLFPNWLRRRPASEHDTRFGFAVVGIGHIAGKVVEALRDSPHARVTAAVSQSLERAQAFARKHNIPSAYTYEQWDLIAADPAIDAMYLALPVAHHREFAEQSFAAGKHVLCEKPMASTVADCRRMIDAAYRSSRLLMLAYRLDYDPMHDELKRMLAADTLGHITHVTSGFGFVAKPGWRLDPILAGGGSLFDVGVYPIHALHELFGATTITSARIIEDAATGMEMDAAWSGTLANGATFEGSSSYLRDIPDSLTIHAERGALTLTHAYDYNRTMLHTELTTADGTKQTLNLSDSKRNPLLFRLECEHLAHCANTGTRLLSPGEAGLRDMQTIAAIEAIAQRSTGAH